MTPRRRAGRPATSGPSVRRVYLVRHAKAGDREQWHGPDPLRPLTELGYRQSAALVRTLRIPRIDRILSSPAVRSVDTVLPLSRVTGVPIEHHSALGEGADPKRTLAFMRRLRCRTAVLCSHGDVIEGILELLTAQGVRLSGGVRLPKASTWILNLAIDGKITARYRRPPA